MGSGCNNCKSFDTNSCTDIISSNCVRWEGEAYEDFDICVNDTLTEVVTFILDKLKDILEGKGILLPDISFEDCIYLKDFLGIEEKNLINVLIAYKKAICDLNDRINTLNLTIEEFTDLNTYVLGCLDLVVGPCDPVIKFHTLIQAIITKLCDLQDQYDSISNSILSVIEDATGNFLQQSIVSCGGNGITYSGLGATTKVTIEALVPPYAPIVYIGSLVYFDITGKGLDNTPMCGWYLCNGQNNTPNSTSLPQNLANNIKYIVRFT